MATETRKGKGQPARGPSELELTWEIARFFPPQGEWTEEEYFSLPTNKGVEFSDGTLEFLPMPTIFHQLILQFLFRELEDFVKARSLGLVVLAGYKVRIRRRKYREPDILFIHSDHKNLITKQYCKKADLVIEVVSEENREHDIKKKRGEYAVAGIPEYWIVDPEAETITVLVLKPRKRTYVEHGVFAKGDRATSKLLPGLSVDVTTAVTQKPKLPK
jgi:Uma2 family endonuclease